MMQPLCQCASRHELRYQPGGVLILDQQQQQQPALGHTTDIRLYNRHSKARKHLLVLRNAPALPELAFRNLYTNQGFDSQALSYACSTMTSSAHPTQLLQAKSSVQTWHTEALITQASRHVGNLTCKQAPRKGTMCGCLSAARHSTSLRKLTISVSELMRTHLTATSAPRHVAR